jgi:NAD(P)-dependent dehydrogenase (short-subunit alcohol dehydrogenase family)
VTTLRELSNLKGRRALITGAGGHLGKVFGDTLAELGANLILVDLPGSNLEEMAARLIKQWGASVSIVYCDLEIQGQRLELIDNVKATGESLHILINNAAFGGTTKLSGWNVPLEEQTVETWRRAFEVNLVAVFELSQGLLPLMQKSNGASIVNIASIYGLFGPNWSIYKDTGISNPAAYSASKGGVIQFTRWLATTIAPSVRVNAISPGGIFRNQHPEFVSRYESRVPLNRMGIEDDFRGAIAYLASDLSSYVTGHVLQVDGGWGVW